MLDKTKRIETIFEQNTAPESKNVLWLDNSTSNLKLKRFINGEWTPIISYSNEEYIEIAITSFGSGISTFQLTNEQVVTLVNNPNAFISVKIDISTESEGTIVEFKTNTKCKYQGYCYYREGNVSWRELSYFSHFNVVMNTATNTNSNRSSVFNFITLCSLNTDTNVLTVYIEGLD